MEPYRLRKGGPPRGTEEGGKKEKEREPDSDDGGVAMVGEGSASAIPRREAWDPVHQGKGRGPLAACKSNRIAPQQPTGSPVHQQEGFGGRASMAGHSVVMM